MVGSGASGGDDPNSAPKIAPAARISDNLNLQITTHKLSGKNYVQWSRSVELVVRGKGKFGYLDGTTKKPVAAGEQLSTWENQNAMVMAWLIHSMEDTIGDTYLFYTTAKEIWEAVSLAYSDSEDSSQIYELRNRARNLRQGEMQVTQYFLALKKLWQEIDTYRTFKWNNTDDAAQYNKVLAEDRIYDFLAGLNNELDDVRGRIFAQKPLPSIDTVFFEVRREESRKRVMLGKSSILNVESSALAVHSAENHKKPQPWCDHCQRPYHTKDTCWKIHGKPPNWVPKRAKGKDGKGFLATSETDNPVSSSPVSFSKEQMDHICKILSNTNVSSSMMAHKGPVFGEDDWEC